MPLMNCGKWYCRYKNLAQYTKSASESDQEISRSTTNINNELNIINDLNGRVARAEVLTQPSGEERDERDRAVNRLAEQMDIRVVEDRRVCLRYLQIQAGTYSALRLSRQQATSLPCR